MAQPTLAVPVATGSTTTINTINNNGQAAMANSQPVVIAIDQSAVPVSIATAPVLVAGSAIIGKFGIDQTTPGTTNGVQITLPPPMTRKKTVSTTITRPANTTAYAAGQNINTATSALTAFSTLALGIGNSAQYTLLALKVISTNGSAATKLQPSLAIFNVSNPSGGGFNDASTFNPTGAALAVAGNILIPNVPSTFPNGTAAYCLELLNIALVGTTDSSGNVYLAPVAQNAYTPISGEVLMFVLDIEY